MKEIKSFDVIEMPYLIQVEESNSTLSTLCDMVDTYLMEYLNGETSNLFLHRYALYVFIRLLKLNIINFSQSQSTVALIKDKNVLEK